MKSTFCLFGLLLVLSSSSLAEVKNFSIMNGGVSCPENLEIDETYQAGSLIQLKISFQSRGNPYFSDNYFCSNVIGSPLFHNGSSLACKVSKQTSSENYFLTMIYEQPSRDPSDYGLTYTYKIERTSNTVRLWGKYQSHDGKPMPCDYK